MPGRSTADGSQNHVRSMIKLLRGSPHVAMSSRRAPSKHLEIFAMLPFGHFRLEAVDLGILDVDVIVDEFRAELLAEERIVLQRGDRLAQGLRQRRRLGLVGRVGGRAGIELAVDAVEPERICEAM